MLNTVVFGERRLHRGFEVVSRTITIDTGDTEVWLDTYVRELVQYGALGAAPLRHRAGDSPRRGRESSWGTPVSSARPASRSHAFPCAQCC
jgi:hypothetical protein